MQSDTPSEDSQNRVERLSDRYDHIGSLGSGGMAIVYKARDRQLDRVVAIKRLSTENYTDGMIPRFEREARALATLKHPNIVDVYDFGLDEEHWPFLVMDFIEGETLEELIADKKLTNLDIILEIFIQLLDGLGHAHSKDIVHRDLKPGNVMIQGVFDSDRSERIVVKLMDFGIAKSRAESSQAAWQTQMGQVLGSPLYMSPEQTMTPDVDSRSDIYSVGCMFFESLTGHAPFRGSSWLETMTMHRSTPVARVNDLLERMPAAQPVLMELESIIQKSMQKTPSDRYQSAFEFQSALRNLQTRFRQIDKESAIASNRQATKNNLKRTSIIAAGIAIAALSGAGLLAIMDADIKPSANKKTNAKKEINNDIRLVGVHQGLLGRSWNDYWVSFDDNDRKNELTSDIKFTDLPRAKVKTVAVGHRIEKLDEKRSDYRRDLHGISYLTNLRRISIRNMDFTDDVIKELSTIKTLEDVLITDTVLPAGSLRYFSRLPNLYHLALENCDLQPEDIKQIPKFKSLRKLSFDGNQLLNASILHPVSSMELVDELSLMDTSVPDAVLDEVSRMPSLRNLKVDGRFITHAGMKKIGQMAHLERLKLEWCKTLNAKSMSELAKMPNLKELQLDRCPNVDDKCVESMLKMTSLEELSALGTKLSDAAVIQLKEAKPSLIVKHSNFEDIRGVVVGDDSR